MRQPYGPVVVRVRPAASYLGEFVAATKLRNELTHPKADPPNIGEAAVARALKAIIEWGGCAT
jgi:hypothetical protein